MNIRQHKGRVFKKEREHRINEEIDHSTVRITGEGIESKVVSRQEALSIAQSLNRDLVEIVANAQPPVCRIINYDKLMYEKKQIDKERKKPSSEVKELRLTATTDEHDLNFKTKHAINWLKDGDKVKAVLLFKGRMIQHKQIGEVMLLKLSEALQEYGKPEGLPKLEGKKMYMMFSPKRK